MDVVMQAGTQYLAFAPPTAVSWIAFVVIGGIAGWLAGKIVKGDSCGKASCKSSGVFGVDAIKHPNCEVGAHKKQN